MKLNNIFKVSKEDGKRLKGRNKKCSGEDRCRCGLQSFAAVFWGDHEALLLREPCMLTQITVVKKTDPVPELVQC